MCTAVHMLKEDKVDQVKYGQHGSRLNARHQTDNQTYNSELRWRDVQASVSGPDMNPGRLRLLSNSTTSPRHAQPHHLRHMSITNSEKARNAKSTKSSDCAAPPTKMATRSLRSPLLAHGARSAPRVPQTYAVRPGAGPGSPETTTPVEVTAANAERQGQCELHWVLPENATAALRKNSVNTEHYHEREEHEEAPHQP